MLADLHIFAMKQEVTSNTLFSFCAFIASFTMTY